MQQVRIKYRESFAGQHRLQYVLAFLNQHPLNEDFHFLMGSQGRGDLNICYGVVKEGFSMPFDAQFMLANGTEHIELQANEYSWDVQKIIAVESMPKERERFFQDQSFGFDIFNTIFFHISRYEEVFAKEDQLGQAGWLKEDQHFLVQNDLQDRPVVDELVVAFLQVLGANIQRRPSTYDLSHDVDILGRFTPFSKLVKSLGATLFYRRGAKQLWGSLSHYRKMLKGEVGDPYDTFDDLLREESVWKRKHIYFMAGGNTKYDNHYQLRDQRLNRVIAIAQDRGYEIGLHPSYNAGFEEAMYTREKSALEKRIESDIVLNRQHWLRFNWQITPEIWAENGIIQDASMGYNRYLGFRCGTGFAYHMYDFKRERAYAWKEQPMAFMESSAIHQAKLSEVELSELMKTFLRKNKYGTHISFNFHNSNFDPTLETGRVLTHFYKNELLSLLEED